MMIACCFQPFQLHKGLRASMMLRCFFPLQPANCWSYTLQAERKADPFGQDAAPVPPRVPRGVPVHGTHNAHVPPEAIWVFGQCREIHLEVLIRSRRYTPVNSITISAKIWRWRWHLSILVGRCEVYIDLFCQLFKGPIPVILVCQWWGRLGWLLGCCILATLAMSHLSQLEQARGAENPGDE